MNIMQKLDELIVDFSSQYKDEVTMEVISKNPRSINQLNIIIREFKNKKGFSKIGRNTKEYWIQRGWSVDESIEKKSKYKVNHQPNGSPMSVNYWIKKNNPKTGNPYTLEEAQYKVKSQRPFNKEYWIERGFSIDEAELEVSRSQKRNSGKRLNYKGVTWNQYEYWIKKGMNIEEAKSKVSDLQKTIDLNKLIDKHGDIEGRERYDNICKNLSFSQSLEGKISNYGEIEGRIRYKNDLYKKCNISPVSKESLRFFIPIYKQFRKYFGKEEIYWGIDGSKEYFIYDENHKKIFFYDFCIPKIKLIIEYQGVRWHPNPSWNSEKWDKWSLFGMNSTEKRSLDLTKNSVAESRGFKIIEVFSDEVQNFTIDIKQYSAVEPLCNI